MDRLRKVLDRIFIDGLSAMAQGLFATLIIGTIIQQIGTLLGGTFGDMIYVIGKAAASLTLGVPMCFMTVLLGWGTSISTSSSAV